MKVLAVGCHPDDVEFFCAGTIALLKEAGWEVAIAVVAKGDCGSLTHSRKEITAIRRGEAEAAAKLLDAEIHFMGQSDLDVVCGPAQRKIAVEVIRKTRPDMVITHPPSDYMTDHEFTSRLVRDACFGASAPNYETEVSDPANATDAIPTLYYCAPPEGIDLLGRPAPVQFYVDISTKLDLKREMLACHASQRDWLKAQHGVDQYLIEMENWARSAAEGTGFEYAEGFHQHLGHAYPKENVIGKVLGDKVRSV